MFKSFLSRVIVTFTLIVVIIITSMVLVQNYYYTNLYTQNVIEEIETETTGLAVKVGKYYDNNSYGAQVRYTEAMEFLSSKYNALIWVVDTQGNIVESKGAESSFAGYRIPESMVGKYITPALTGRTVRTTDFFQAEKDDPIVTIFVPVEASDGVVAVLAVNAHVANLSSFTKTISQSMWMIPFIAFFISAVFVYLASTFISRPLNELNKLAMEAGKGNFNYRYDINSKTEIAHIGENLNKMMSRLSKMEKFRSDFVQNASHELKAPITVISGYCQALMDDDMDREKQKEYLHIILSETDRMKQLIETLMSLSRIESGNDTLNKEHFNINDVLSRNLLAFEIEIEKKNLDIEVNYENDKLEVCADKAKIEQVVINLLQNAIKYTREDDKIIITTRQVKAKAYIEIMDTGIGIEKKEMDNIFDRFYTVDKAKTPGKSGSGIGLSLVKKILELHDSHIYVDSVKDEYTKFYFYLDM